MRNKLETAVVKAALEAGPARSIRAQHEVTDEQIELSFHSDIGAWWDQTTSQDVADLLSRNRGKPVSVRINSMGGSVFDGLGIYNMLIAHDGEVGVIIEGLAASIASVIALAGDWVKAYPNTSLMLHRAWTVTYGNAGQLRAEADILDKVDDQLVATYAAKTGASKETVANWMRGGDDADGSWFSAEEALEMGLIDEILPLKGPSARAASKAVVREEAEAAVAEHARKVMTHIIDSQIREAEYIRRRRP